MHYLCLPLSWKCHVVTGVSKLLLGFLMDFTARLAWLNRRDEKHVCVCVCMCVCVCVDLEYSLRVLRKLEVWVVSGGSSDKNSALFVSAGQSMAGETTG